MIFFKKNLNLKIVFNPICLIAKTIILLPLSVDAQIIPDNTLGVESSVISPIDSNPLGHNQPRQNRGSLRQSLIEGGAIRGDNLFHSFQEFNINSGQEINFSNPDNIANIFSRVTGNNISQIFGKLGVNGDANLFLINPNGIVLGEAAKINLNGAFFATTADSIIFSDGNSFSAAETTTSPILTVNIPVGLQLGNNPQAIQSNQAEINAQSISLIGGNLELQKTRMSAPGGEVQLLSVAEAGTINFNASLPEDLGRGDISISDRSSVSTIADGEGDITLQARNFTLENSNFQVGIAERQGNPEATGGNIYLNTTGDIQLLNSNINNDLQRGSSGNAGKIRVVAQNLIMENSRIASATNSTGNAGDLEVIVADRLSSISNSEANSDVPVPPNPPERNPDVATNAPRPDSDRQARDNPPRDNPPPPRDPNSPEGNNPPPSPRGSNPPPENRNPPRDNPPPTEHTNNSSTPPNNNNQQNPTPASDRKGLFSNANSRSRGNGGNIRIEASELTLSGFGGISASVTGDGNGGQVTVISDRILVNQGASISANTGGNGNAGKISLQVTDSILIDSTGNTRLGSNGRILPGGIIADVRRGEGIEGNGGNVSIQTGSLKVMGGAIITTDTKSSGDGGSIEINATESITIQNTNDRNTQIVSAVRRNSPGAGGDIAINTKDLFLLDGALINAETDHTSDAGNISIQATGLVQLSGTSLNGISSQILAQVGENAAGKGGNINLSAKNLIIADGGQISASTLGSGEGGRVNLAVADKIEITGSVPAIEIQSPRTDNYVTNADGTIPSGIFASSPGEGDANALGITADSLFLSKNARISVDSQQQGDAGSLTIQADRIELDSAALSAEAVQGAEANINLSASQIELRNSSRISTDARGEATGGNIRIDTDTLVALENSDITANAQQRSGGQVTITASGVFGTAVRPNRTPKSDITASSELGAQFNGVIQLNTSNADPVSGLAKLPENFRDASNQIIAGCSLDKNNSFVVTGRGGLPDNSGEFLLGENILQDWRITEEINLENTDSLLLKMPHLASNQKPDIIEAQQLILNSQGSIELVAQVQNRSQEFWLAGMSCRSLS